MRITPIDLSGEPLLDPDLVFENQLGDLALTAFDDPINPSGLQAKSALQTAILICLGTDLRVEDYELDANQSNRGWVGDGFDLQAGETPLGSRLWLLRRRALTDDIILDAQDYAEAALQTLIDQGAVAKFVVTATVEKARNRLILQTDGYARDGGLVFDDRFQILWDQLNVI